MSSNELNLNKLVSNELNSSKLVSKAISEGELDSLISEKNRTFKYLAGV
ncbi:hypothetical protein FXV91_08020 [Methanosarcina sp. DH2]|jgi:hypothetical protein|nr:hypothetical protein [Methanosarcina sp. DH2]MCC4770142.1 hypothetical protein [Methanosarcina sp. DH2]